MIHKLYNINIKIHLQHSKNKRIPCLLVTYFFVHLFSYVAKFISCLQQIRSNLECMVFYLRIYINIYIYTVRRLIRKHFSLKFNHTCYIETLKNRILFNTSIDEQNEIKKKYIPVCEHM